MRNVLNYLILASLLVACVSVPAIATSVTNTPAVTPTEIAIPAPPTPEMTPTESLQMPIKSFAETYPSVQYKGLSELATAFELLPKLGGWEIKGIDGLLIKEDGFAILNLGDKFSDETFQIPVEDIRLKDNKIWAFAFENTENQWSPLIIST
jgi:hypothetical protein